MANELKHFLDYAGLEKVWAKIKALNAAEAAAREAGDAALAAQLAQEVADLNALIAAEEARAKAEEAKKIDREIVGPNAKSLIFNEADGGGSKLEGANDKAAYVGTHDNINGKLGVQLYADKNANESTIIDVTEAGAFYTKGELVPASQRDVEANEIATKGDIAAIEIPEYSMVKEADPGEYAAIYHLTKDGVNVGVAINIAKDQLLKSVEVKTCTEKDVPVEGLLPGDKYIDFTFIVEGGAEAHSYIAVKDMVKPYTAGEGIIISADNEISVDTEVISTVEYVDANISDTMSYVMQEDAAERAARIGGDNLLEAKKVDKEVTGTNGKALIFNEQDGGGAKYEFTDGSASFVGVNNGGANGNNVVLYSVDDEALGARVKGRNDGFYYFKGANKTPEAGDEIATIADVEAHDPQSLTDAEIEEICQ